MTITTQLRACLARLPLFGLLSLVLGLLVAYPRPAAAKKSSRAKCSRAHAKSHRAKLKNKRCVKRVSRRRPAGRSPASPQRSGAPSGATPTASGDAARCQREEAQDPAGFADLYGIGPEDEGAFDNCLDSSHDGASTGAEPAEDSG